MDGWTNIPLPHITDSVNWDRMTRIAKWVNENGFDETGIAISSRIVRFKNAEEASFFVLSFEGAV